MFQQQNNLMKQQEQTNVIQYEISDSLRTLVNYFKKAYVERYGPLYRTQKYRPHNYENRSVYGTVFFDLGDPDQEQ